MSDCLEVATEITCGDYSWLYMEHDFGLWILGKRVSPSEITLDPEKILQFFEIAKPGDKLFIPPIPNHEIYKDREFVKKFLYKVPSQYKNFGIFDDYQLACIGVSSRSKTNIFYVDERIVDTILFRHAIRENADNWYWYNESPMFGTYENMMLFWKIIETEPDDYEDEQRYRDLLEYAGRKFPEAIYKFYEYESQDFYMRKFLEFRFDIWDSDDPKEVIFAVLKEDKSAIDIILAQRREEIRICYTYPIRDPGDCEDFMRVVYEFDPEIALKYVSPRLLDLGIFSSQT